MTPTKRRPWCRLLLPLSPAPPAQLASPTATGRWTFSPPADYPKLVDIPPYILTFTYTIQDTLLATSAPGTVSVTVTPVNDPPVADDDGDTTNQGIPVTINVVAGDSDIDGSVVASTAQIVSGPTNGSVANNGDGTFTYTPNVGPFLTDSFTYQVLGRRRSILSNVATVTITIRQPELDIVKDALPDWPRRGRMSSSSSTSSTTGRALPSLPQSRTPWEAASTGSDRRGSAPWAT